MCVCVCVCVCVSRGEYNHTQSLGCTILLLIIYTCMCAMYSLFISFLTLVFT